jgi:hypothetical protein
MSRGHGAAMLLALTLTACERAKDEQANAELRAMPESAVVPATSPSPGPSFTISPPGGPPGTGVTLSMGGLIMNQSLDVGFGDMGENVIIGAAQADVDGNVSTTVKVPADAKPGTHFFFLAAKDGPVVATPTAFLVTSANGKVTLTGKMSDEGVECRALRGAAGELYTLTGADDWPAPGTDVTVVGMIAEMSTCQQGITIAVESIKAR